MTLSAYLKARRAEIDAALAAAFPPPPATPQVLFDAMRYSLEAGGKRLRPALCLASAEAVGGDRGAALPAACAIELIHTYSLVHDDLPAMDDDTMRRGRPTLHVVAGEGMAILAGDGLLTEAFALLARGLPAEAGSHNTTDRGFRHNTTDRGFRHNTTDRGFRHNITDRGFRLQPDDQASRTLRVIGVIATAAGATGMVGGQAVDLATVGTTLDGDALRAMHAMKTGALIRAAAVSGAIMGGGRDDEVDAIDRAAAELGLAFQIVDDILDVEAESKDLGKTAGKDAAAGKPTYPALYGLERSKHMATECLTRAEERLRSAGLADSRLLEIGQWIVGRGN